MVAKKNTSGNMSPRISAAKLKGRRFVAPKPKAKTSRKEKKFETILVEVFRAHWKAINRRIASGVDIAQKFADAFFFVNPREGLRIARRYYAPVRAARLANASAAEILRLSDAWIGPAHEFIEESSDMRKQIRQLVAAEYIALVWNYDSSIEFPPKGFAWVHPLPDTSVIYGDVYEITASGFSTGAKLRVCKSVAEPFLKSERREAMAGIEREFYANARSDDYPDAENQWFVDFVQATDMRAIDVNIWENGDWEDPDL